MKQSRSCLFILNRSLIVLTLLISHSAYAVKPLFTSIEPLQAVLTAPLTQTYREKKQTVRLYQEGSLSYKFGTDRTNRLAVKIRTRGNFRRLNCALPPLRLNFAKKANDSTIFERQDKLKLVGPCKPGSAYQDLLGLEYLVYKIWQELSPYHFKTRLVDLNYIDTNRKRKPWKATTFVIEEVDDMAKRLDLRRLAQPKVKRQQMHLAQTALLELFQLMIGNSDYSTLAAPAGDNCCHNARLLVKPGSSNNAIPVPYDFDVAGFVDAPYATPAPQYPIKNVRQRYFTGWCKEDRHFKNAIRTIQDKKTTIYEIIRTASVISDRSRKKATRYLDGFFTIIDDQKRVQREVIDRCRGSVVPG